MKKKNDKQDIRKYVEFKRNVYSDTDELKLKASDAQLKQMSKKQLNRLLGIGLKGNDYKKVMLYAKM